METQPEILSNKTPFCLVLFFFFSLFFYYYNDKYEPGYKLVPAKEEHVRSRPPVQSQKRAAVNQAKNSRSLWLCTGTNDFVSIRGCQWNFLHLQYPLHYPLPTAEEKSSILLWRSSRKIENTTQLSWFMCIQMRLIFFLFFFKKAELSFFFFSK